MTTEQEAAPDAGVEKNRSLHACNDFVDSGEWLYPHHLQGVQEHRIARLCGTCGWAETCHHAWVWRRGWSCGTCGRTAYPKDGRCTVDQPPTDYPPCGRSWGDGDTD